MGKARTGRICTGLASVVAVLLGCDGPRPAEVYVPGARFTTTVVARTAGGDSATVRVGEPLVLHAVRRSGPWVIAAPDTLAPDAPWMIEPPPNPEIEVADNLHWIVEPPGAATFNLGVRPDHTREVIFEEPGTYTLIGRSATLTGEPVDAAPLHVTVTR